MRKVKIGVALFAVLAFGVVSVGSASAAQWLKGGNEITQQELAITEGTWTLTGKGIFGIGELKVECNGKLIGFVGPKAEDLVTEAIGLNAGETKLIDCTIKAESVIKCTGVGTLALVEAEHLTWGSVLREPAAGEFKDEFKEDTKGKPAFKVFCLLESPAKWTSELCEGNVLTDALTNVAGGVFGEVLKAKSESCKTGGNTAEVNAKGTTKLALTSEALTVSK